MNAISVKSMDVFSSECIYQNGQKAYLQLSGYDGKYLSEINLETGHCLSTRAIKGLAFERYGCVEEVYISGNYLVIESNQKIVAQIICFEKSTLTFVNEFGNYVVITLTSQVDYATRYVYIYSKNERALYPIQSPKLSRSVGIIYAFDSATQNFLLFETLNPTDRNSHDSETVTNDCLARELILLDIHSKTEQVLIACAANEECSIVSANANTILVKKYADNLSVFYSFDIKSCQIEKLLSTEMSIRECINFDGSYAFVSYTNSVLKVINSDEAELLVLTKPNLLDTQERIIDCTNSLVIMSFEYSKNDEWFQGRKVYNYSEDVTTTYDAPNIIVDGIVY